MSKLLGESTGQSLQGPQLINPINGDFSKSESLFSVNTVGGSLSTKLTYDSSLAQAQAATGATYVGYFGWGWTSTINDSAINNAFGQVTLNEPNGAAVTFSPATSDSCGTGDYQAFQKYTTSDSYLPWCATSRLDAQLGSYGGVGYKITEGNGNEAGYSWTGQLAWSGTRSDPQALTYTYNIAPGGGGSGVPASDSCALDGESSCFDITDGTHCVSTEINTFGLIQKVIDPAQQTWIIGYDTANLNITSITDVGSGSVTLFSYNSTVPSPYNHQMNAFSNPSLPGTPTGTTLVAYLPAGMANQLVDPSGGVTGYVFSNTTCVTTAGCVGIGVTQFTEVSYQDGVNDFDNFEGGVLVSNSWGPAASFADPTGLNQKWVHSYTWATYQVGYSYDTITMPTGSTAVVLYDALGNVVAYQDPNGNTLHAMYNDTGGNDLDELCWMANPGVAIPSDASCSNPPPGSTSYTYDANGNMLTTTDPIGNKSYQGYYSDGLLCWTAESTAGNGSPCTGGDTITPNGAPPGSTVYEYILGNLAVKTVGYQTTDGSGNSTAQTTISRYDADSQLTCTIPPDGASGPACGSNPFETLQSYQSYGVLQTTTAPYGRQTTDVDDGAGNVLTETDPAGVTTTAYDTSERKCWSIRAFVAISSPTCSAPPAGATVYGYLVDTATVTTMINPNGHATTYTYADYQHRTKPTYTNDQMGTQGSFDLYNTYGQVCLSGPGTGGFTSCPTTVGAIPTSDVGSMYNSEGQLLSQTDQNGKTTYYSYSTPGYPMSASSKTDPLGKITKYGYDADGRFFQGTNPSGSVVTIGFDSDGRECYTTPISPVPAGASCSSPPSGPGVTTMKWNALDERSQMTDNSGTSSSATSLYSYDLGGNLTSQTDDNGRVVSYSYDNSGAENCIAYPVIAGSSCKLPPNSTTNSVVDRSFDSAGRLYTVTDWLGNTTTYLNYNELSQARSIAFPNGISENFAFDPVGNVTSIDYSGTLAGAGTSAANNSWTYNGDEEESSTTQLGVYSSSSDTYSPYGQVNSAANPTGTGSINDVYTNAGNSELKADNPSGKSEIDFYYNNGAQLTGQSNPNLPVGSSATSYGYNADGQRCWSSTSSSLVGSTDCSAAPAISSTTSYQWNALGQLCWSGASSLTGSQCSTPPTGVTTYAYDGDGLRSSETPPATSGLPLLTFSWDTVDNSKDPLLLDDGTNAYVYGSTLFGGTAPIEQINIASKSVSFLSSIPSGVQLVTSPTAAVLEKAAYTTYGHQVIEAGSVSSPFSFDGTYLDPTGLNYMISRYYDSSTSEFLSIDPLVSKTLEPYAFTGNDPLNGADANGLCDAPDVMTISACNAQNAKWGSDWREVACDYYFQGCFQFPFPGVGSGGGAGSGSAASARAQEAAKEAADERLGAYLRLAHLALEAAQAAAIKSGKAVIAVGGADLLLQGFQAAREAEPPIRFGVGIFGGAAVTTVAESMFECADLEEGAVLCGFYTATTGDSAGDAMAGSDGVGGSRLYNFVEYLQHFGMWNNSG